MKQHRQNFSYLHEVMVQGLKPTLAIDAPPLEGHRWLKTGALGIVWNIPFQLLPHIPTEELYLLSYMTYAFKNLIKTFFLVLR